STTPVIAGDSFEMDAVGALRLSPLRRGLAIDSTVDIFTFYVPHRHVYGEQWIKFMKDGVNATPLPTVNTTGYIDHAAFLRSEERFSRNAETDLVCRLLLEKKKKFKRFYIETMPILTRLENKYFRTNATTKK